MISENHSAALIQRILAAIEDNGGMSALSSIILTGSFGRDEPTYTQGEGNEKKLISDVEIAVICPTLRNKRVIEEVIRKVSAEFEEDINLMVLSENRVKNVRNYNYSCVTPGNKTLFTYDLYNGSRTIWGRDFLGERRVMLNEVDSYEAKRIVANRIGELVFLQTRRDLQGKEELRIQWKGKVILAVASAWLLCEGLYSSPYREQCKQIREYRSTAESVIGEGFAAVYTKTFSYLREGGPKYEVPDDLLRLYISNVDKYLQEKKITRPRTNCASRRIKLFLRYLKAGMGYGFVSYEEKIIQALIDDFCSQSGNIDHHATVWHKVLH